MSNSQQGYPRKPKALRWPLLLAIIALHALALWGLARALVPDFTRSLERDVYVSIMTVTISAPEEEDPIPEQVSETAMEDGASGAAGEFAVPEPETAPEPPLPLNPDQDLPEVTSTGSATTSGGAEQGDGTGASSAGAGTGSGDQGTGQGQIAVSRPVHISGAIDDARDYPTPSGGRAIRRGSEVIVRVIVGIDGHASQCSIYRASVDPEADAITCRLVVERLRFRPAMDAAGDPVPAPFYWRQRWR